MATQIRIGTLKGWNHPQRRRVLGFSAAVTFGLAFGIGPVAALAEGEDDEGPCTQVAALQAQACSHEVRDDDFTARAICTNAEEDEQRECIREARSNRREGLELCEEQLDSREDLCDALGDERYDSNFDPALFASDFAHPSVVNPYFPLGIGNLWDYAGAGETIRREVLDKTKRIEGVTCVVVNDRVEIDGLLHEDTDDWYGQRLDGTVDYCGESVRDFEFIEGDQPLEAELVDIAGSFKAGKDGAQAGTQMPGTPVAGTTHRQEWAPGNAEDAASIRSTTYAYGADAELDAFVPQGLAELLCAAGDCIVTDEFSPIEPAAIGRKYYARGIGFFLEVKPASGVAVQLEGCNFDSRCALLPQP